MSLFDAAQNASGVDPSAPLAARMRPRTLDELVGHVGLLGDMGVIRSMVASDQITSMILWGPPGCGKSTLARIIAAHTQCSFLEYSAVTSGVADVRAAVKHAREMRALYGRRTIVFIDEIHRFSRTQQDAFLPHVEDGTMILLGATTENPYFAITSPLLSRARVVRLEPLGEDDLRRIMDSALRDAQRGLGAMQVQLGDEERAWLVRMCGGDARTLLNTLENAVLTTPPDTSGVRVVTLSSLERVLQQKATRYDRTGDQHYDTASAFIKSMRGSDPDAALHYLARMLRAGEDPRFIARRMLILASEDIGNADPMALTVATNVLHAVQFVGMPEARIILAQGVTYLACAPKSNASYLAIDAAIADLDRQPERPVPPSLRGTGYRGAADLGHGVGYQYPHDYPGHWVAQRYLPDGAWQTPYYQPVESGYERRIAERLNQLRRQSGEPEPAKCQEENTES